MSDNKILFVAVLLGCVASTTWLLKRAGLMKPDDEVHPSWAYLRWRLVMVGIAVLGGGFYFLFVQLAA